MSPLSRRQLLIASGAATFGLAGCASRQSGPARPEHTTGTATARSSDPAGIRHAKPLVLTQTQQQADRTLASVTRLDKHPLWFMTWYGDGATIAEHHTTASNANYVPGFACTLWVATGTHGEPIVGRNWDWEHGPGLAMASRTKAARTLTLTDTTFLGLGDGSKALDSHDEKTQEALLHAETQLVEGINEHGVFIGLAADEQGIPTTSKDRPVVGGLSVQRLVLDRSRTVEDAINTFRSVDVDFTGGPALHYLVADRHGGAAVIEFDQGKLYVERRPAAQPWLCLENFHMATVKGKDRAQQTRWSTCAKTLGAAHGVMDEEAAFDLLDNVRQGITQWSSVYDLAAGTVSVHTSVGKHSLTV